MKTRMKERIREKRNKTARKIKENGKIREKR